MGVDLRGYNKYFMRQVIAGSATSAVLKLPQISERIDIIHQNGSPAWICFDGDNTTPYGNAGSIFLMISGNSVTYPIRTGSVYVLGSAGSPIGASTSTVQVTAWY